ncbi:isochorismatase family protein [Saccharicrinis sp. FJH2]|uniref:isochorismatase family protein n=1 Tax=Saccharicrinis sp. FJH65 TaxID=3344659 RepID=UPI0035F4E3D8
MKALLIVDLQNDFLPGGALPAPDGNNIIPVVNNLMEDFHFVIASKDWHPNVSVHFEKWPVHCVRGSLGSKFPVALRSKNIDLVLRKGTEDTDDGYSAFEATNVNLVDVLNEREVTELYVCGLTTEYCVKETVLDAIKNGFKTFVIKNATEAVKANPGDEEKAWKEMYEAGAVIVDDIKYNGLSA